MWSGSWIMHTLIFWSTIKLTSSQIVVLRMGVLSPIKKQNINESPSLYFTKLWSLYKTLKSCRITTRSMLCFIAVKYLNNFNVFSGLIEVSKRRENCINAHSVWGRVAYCCKSFPVFFLLILRLPEKYKIYSLHLIFIAFQQRNL